MRLTKAVAEAVTDRKTPAAVLALAYAETIEQATHVPLALASALDTLRRAAELLDEADETKDATRAFGKIAAVVATATILDRLGPKLLATLDALLITPKAKAALRDRLDNAGDPASPLDPLRERHGTRHLRAAG